MMLVRTLRLIAAISIIVAPAFSTAAKDSACQAFSKNDEGQWVARQGTTFPGTGTAIKAGQTLTDAMQDELDARCVLSRNR
jgi:hypothetical protein